jgi:hypothetical protein
MAEIDDLGGVLIRDQTIEQRHLAIDVADNRYRGLFGQELHSRAFANIEIEGCDQTTLMQMEVSKQPPAGFYRRVGAAMRQW